MPHGEVLEPTGEFEPAHRSYPWDQWLDGHPHRITPSHYTGDPRDFRSYMYAIARKRGVKVAVAVEPNDCLVFQSYPRGGQRPKLPGDHARHANGKPADTTPAAPAPKDHGTCNAEQNGEVCGAKLNRWGKLIGRCATYNVKSPGHIIDVHRDNAVVVLPSVESNA